MRLACTLLILLATLITASVKAETLKVASWNIAWLGSYKFNKRTPSDYLELARYAKQLNADVISLQEIESAEWERKVFGDEYDCIQQLQHGMTS